MTRRNIPENKKSQRVQKGHDSIPWRYCLLTFGCGAILIVGFFLAARQHFSSIDFGIKNSRLRQQIENLEGDKRRFQLAREIALSPAEIKKAAQKLGFREMTASNIEVYRPAKDAKEKPKSSLIERPKQTFLEAVGTLKKEDKKSDRNDKKDDGKSSDAKENRRTQIAKK